jgi:hypothetical protein
MLARWQVESLVDRGRPVAPEAGWLYLLRQFQLPIHVEFNSQWQAAALAFLGASHIRRKFGHLGRGQ